MKRIHKYPLPLNSVSFSVSLPLDWELLRVGFQNEQLFMWVLCDPSNQMRNFNFRLFGTGQDILGDVKYLSTYDIGPLVLHLFLDTSHQ